MDYGVWRVVVRVVDVVIVVGVVIDVGLGDGRTPH